MTNLFEKIFSITSEYSRGFKYKVITILGIKIKIKMKLEILNENVTLQDIYDESFYEGQANASYKSASKVLTIVKNILPEINSVVDVGCGVGTWLKAWQDLNPSINIKGMDANILDDKFLYIPRKDIEVLDITNIKIDRKYDLVQSLEVAEHLEKSEAENFIDSLVKLGDIVLFSAAAPFQTGTHHVNENTPLYWTELFNKRGYVCFDIFRNLIWNDKEISWWYRQNLLLFVNENRKDFFCNNGYSFTNNPNLLYHPDFVKMILGH